MEVSMNNKTIILERVTWIFSFVVSLLTCLFIVYMFLGLVLLNTILPMIVIPAAVVAKSTEALEKMDGQLFMVPFYIIIALVYIYGAVVAIKSFVYYKTRRKNGNYARCSLTSLAFMIPVLCFTVNDGVAVYGNLFIYIFVLDYVLVLLSLINIYAKEDNKINLSKLFNLVSLPIILGGFLYYIMNYRLLDTYEYFSEVATRYSKNWTIPSIYAFIGFVAVSIYMMNLTDLYLGEKASSIFGILFSLFLTPAIKLAYFEGDIIPGVIITSFFIVTVVLNVLSIISYKEKNKCLNESLIIE
jgi:hypothetical protein